MSQIVTPQPTKPQVRIVGTCENLGDTLLIGAPYSHTLVEFCRSLPSSRWDAKNKRWRCDATPLAAWQVDNIGISLDQKSKDLMEQWNQAMLPPRIGELAALINSFKTTPWKHQQRMMAFGINKYGIMMAAGMGVGKTLATICLLQAWASRTVLIACPKSVVGVWRREFHKHCGISHQVVCLDSGTSRDKAKEAELALLRGPQYGVTAIVVNYESIWRAELGEFLASKNWDAVVCDESHRIKEATSQQSKYMALYATKSKRRLALTGTPMPNGGGIDLFGQYKFLEPAIFGTSLTRFRNLFCEMNPTFKSQVVRYKNQDEFNRRYSSIAFRVEAKDVLDLPECVHVTIPVTLEKKTRDWYETMKKQCILEIDKGEITAKNAAVKLMRLHQIACGHSKTEDGITVRLGSEKKDALADLLSDIPKSEPIVVVCRFLEDLVQISEVAKLLGRVYGEISGATKDLTEHSTMPEHVQLMGVQQRAGGVGIDLTRAKYMVWFSAGFSWGEFDQTNARVHRPGQTRTTTIYHLAAEKTVDLQIYKALQNKRDAAEAILDVIKYKDSDGDD